MPFRIQVPDAVLRDLKGRLERARFADEFPDAGWDYGTNLNYIQSLMTTGAIARLARAGTPPEPLQPVQDEHRRPRHPFHPSEVERSQRAAAAPLERVAELAGRVRQGHRTAHQRKAGARPAFHVIVPSMPGYGFSDKPKERGYNPERMAQVWATLMARLGYSRYIVHGSDWGISVATYLALADSSHITALHLAGCPGGLIGPPPPRARGECPAAAAAASSNLGYQEIQTTKPETLGQGLSDSPLGLASWIIDKWHSWSDHDGDLERFTPRTSSSN